MGRFETGTLRASFRQRSGQITEEAAPPKRPWKRVCSVPSDVPDGLTNISGSEITAQYLLRVKAALEAE
jgi:hypothetical protein